MKIGIIQPYFFPYFGYFALINVVDKFVYFDDAQYIRRGWVNRNRIKIENKWHYISLPIQKSPLSFKINEVYVLNDKKKENKIKKMIEYSYRKAPNYQKIFDLFSRFKFSGENISKLNIKLINEICNYLDIKTDVYISSEIKKDNLLKGEEKIIEICKILGANHYINPIGGVGLYSKKRFQEEGIKLSFFKIYNILYNQGESDFIPNLSIIDVLMWNSEDVVKKMLKEYKLIEGKKNEKE